MDEYYKENAKRFATETFFVDLSEQYQRVCPWLKGVQGYLMWGATAGLMYVISRNKDIRWLRWNCQGTFAWKSEKCSQEKSYVLIFRVISQHSDLTASGRARH